MGWLNGRSDIIFGQSVQKEQNNEAYSTALFDQRVTI
jgi:hypothetical protein